MKHKINVIEMILAAVFAIIVMVVTLAVSEDENPFQILRHRRTAHGE